MSDAAGNTATVVQRRIATFNPVLTPKPGHGAVPTRLRLGFEFGGRYTTLASIAARRLPNRGHVSARCLGTGCPALGRAGVDAGRAGRLWQALSQLRFTAGQRLRIVVTAPHRRSERLQLTMRVGRAPGIRLL